MVETARQERETHERSPLNILHQPRAVKAIVFACVISYMGIGLVDPILPTIAKDLNASTGQTELLFTTYLFTMAVVMFFSSWLSSRIGIRTTLLTGLFLVVCFSVASALSGNVSQIIGFRGGWGAGNALFVSTALAAIIGSTADSRAAIVLYEAALGAGMAVGPLAGGLLGQISWRGPFAGTGVLIAIAFLGVALNLRRGAPRPPRVPLKASFAAVGRRDFRPLLIAALLYNFGYFTILTFTPFLLHSVAAARGQVFSPLALGLVFFGWGGLLAVFSVVVAPILTRRLGLRVTLLSGTAAMALVEAVFFVGSGSMGVLLGATLASGALLGLVNTAMTEAAMEATDLPRTVASSSYSGMRFIGAAAAPTLTGPLSKLGGMGMPYGVATLLMLLAVAALVVAHLRSRRPHETAIDEAQIVGESL